MGDVIGLSLSEFRTDVHQDDFADGFLENHGVGRRASDESASNHSNFHTGPFLTRIIQLAPGFDEGCRTFSSSKRSSVGTATPFAFFVEKASASFVSVRRPQLNNPGKGRFMINEPILWFHPFPFRGCRP